MALAKRNRTGYNGKKRRGTTDLRITVLAENTSARGLPAEHGLSLFVEAAGRRFLFDTGASSLFARNADALGIDLDAAEFAVLSHGHNDHGGGLGTFFERNAHAPVYASRYAFEPHLNAADLDIGLDPSLLDSGRFIFVDGELRISEGLTLFPCRGEAPAADCVPGGLKTIRCGRPIPEDFRHEQYLLVEEEGKRVLFSGCSHRGVEHLMERFRPDVLIGGFHFFRLPLDEALVARGAALDAFPAVYYTCHCTGALQYRFLKERMRNLRYLSTGDEIEL